MCFRDNIHFIYDWYNRQSFNITDETSLFVCLGGDVRLLLKKSVLVGLSKYMFSLDRWSHCYIEVAVLSRQVVSLVSRSSCSL